MQQDRQQKNSVFKSVRSILSTLLTVAVILLAAALVGVRLFGYTPYAVLSGSMEPTYHVGSVVYVKDVPAEEIQVGDSITFVRNAGGTHITHRVVAIDAENRSFVTRGDSNATVDAVPVLFENVVGRVDYSLPYLGYLSYYLSRPPGLYWGLAAAVVLLMFTFVVPELLSTGKRGKRAGSAASPEAPQMEPALTGRGMDAARESGGTETSYARAMPENAPQRVMSRGDSSACLGPMASTAYLREQVPEVLKDR